MPAPGSPEPPWGPGKEPPLPPGPPSVPVQTLPHFSATAETSVSSVCAPSHPKGLGLALSGVAGTAGGDAAEKKKKDICPVPEGNYPSARAAPGPATARAAPASPRSSAPGNGARWGLALPTEAAGAPSAVPHRGPGAAGAASPVVPHPRCRPCQCPVPHGKNAVSSGVVTGRGSVPVPGAPVPRPARRWLGGDLAGPPRSHRPEAPARSRPLPPVISLPLDVPFFLPLPPKPAGKLEGQSAPLWLLG